MLLDGETIEIPAGSFVCVPPGVVHTFSNPGAAPVRFLNFNTPAGWENYMRDLGAVLAKGTPSPAQIGENAASAHGRTGPSRSQTRQALSMDDR